MLFPPLRNGLRTHRARLLLTAACVWGSAAPLMVWAQASRPAATQPDRSPQNVQREYQRRFNQLAPGDVQGHYQLAEWCRDQKAYRLLLRQSKHVLSLDANHANAQLLYRIAVDRLKQQTTQTRPAEGQPGPENNDGEFLTPAQIQKLRWAEFLPAPEERTVSPIEARRRATFAAESFRVRFGKGVLTEFLDQMSGDRDFDEKAERTAFLELPPTRQAQLIREHTGDRYQPRIEITSDPLVFRQFQQQVLPLVMNGCGTLACHGGPEAQAWRLRSARPKTEQNLYTNWLILNRAHHGNMPVINRNKPEDSLLLQYGLPLNHATYRHPDSIPLIMPAAREDVRYRPILNWIEILAVPAPRTGVNLPGYAEPTPTTFGGTTKEADEKAPAAKEK
jgi:hypothetical protein